MWPTGYDVQSLQSKMRTIALIVFFFVFFWRGDGVGGGAHISLLIAWPGSDRKVNWFLDFGVCFRDWVFPLRQGMKHSNNLTAVYRCHRHHHPRSHPLPFFFSSSSVMSVCYETCRACIRTRGIRILSIALISWMKQNIQQSHKCILWCSSNLLVFSLKTHLQPAFWPRT